jgi:Sortase domain
VRIPAARSLTLLIAAGAVLVGAGVVLVLQPPRADAPDIAPPVTVRAAAPPSAGPPPSSVRQRPAVPARLPAAPTAVTLPGTPSPLPVVPVGVVGSGQLQLPDDPSVLGWYAAGAVPGAPDGTAVLAGHLDSVQFGAGPLRVLLDAPAGAVVTVTDAAGGVHRYAVWSRTTYRKADLPLQLFRPGGPPRLALVTCGGPFDRRTGQYADNVVVLAAPVR